MAYLLSIGDVRSFNIGDTTIVYTAGTDEDVRRAVKRRDEFITEGLKSSKVGFIKEENYFAMSDAELEKEINAANKRGDAQQKTGVENTTATNPNNTDSNTSANTNGNNTTTPSKNTPGNTATNTTGNNNGPVIYRVQLGAYKNKLSPNVFKQAGKVIELKTEDGYYKYASGSYKTLSDAATHKAELVYEGYEDAFITAYQNGKRVSLSSVGANYENKTYKENLNENLHTGSAVDKSLVSFRVQMGALKKADDTSYDDQLKELKDVEKQPTTSGLVRIMVGNYRNYNDAVKYKASLAEKGFSDAFVIATFKGEVISIQEALD